jgi:hypothetical protein
LTEDDNADLLHQALSIVGVVVLGQQNEGAERWYQRRGIARGQRFVNGAHAHPSRLAEGHGLGLGMDALL